ncbi:hypothetical protein DL96DRAFT_342922 [Flagelloscypha sp. PMI_526]|nr:hypothetical protein DL96DRAFT_342922 [Flagelloscypha sp. PMI_526]
MSLRTGRFSSLKIFGGNGGNSDKKKPPPPPPKDPNYLANLRGTTYVDPSVQFGGDPYANTGRSPYYANSTYQSQSQASFSDTAGPSSYRGGGNYEASVRSVSRTRGNYNPTTTSGGGYENSLASQSAVSLSQQSMTGGSQEGGGSMKKKKGGRWGSLGRNRSKKSLKGAGIDSSSSPSPLDFSDSGHGDSGFVTVDTPEDASISMPWNFQHHVHVDEGYTGLPPSWTARLTAAGFTEEEILSIQARRKSPGPTVPLPHGSRSGSPAPSLPQMPPSLPPSRPSTSPTSVSSPILVNPRTNSPILANPNPRASSLPRKFSDASLRSNPYSVNDVPPVPRIPAGQHSANSSVSSLSSFGAQSNVPSPLGLSRTISPSPGSVLGQSITGGQNRVPRKLVVANEPIPRASTSSSSSASSSESSPPAPPPRPPRLSILEGAKGETAEDWSQSLLSSTLSFDAATGKPLSFNGYSSSATNTDDEGDGEDEDRAGWRDTIVQGKRNTVVPDKRETLKPAPRHAPPKPLTLDVREDEYEEEEDEGEDDEDKRGTIIMDRAPPMSAVTPPGPMQALASVLMNRANGRASPASSPELSPPPQFPTSNGSSPPVVSSPAPPAAYLSESFSNHKPNASVSSLGSVVSPSNSQHSANSASSSNGPLTHRSNGSNSGLANLASRKSASAGAPPQRPPPNLPPPPRPSPPALSSSGSTEIGPPPIAKLPSPPPVPAASSPRPPKRVPPALPLSSPPMFKIQATSIGEEGPVVEREKGTKPQTKRDTLPPPNTAATTGTGNLTPLWKELAGMVRPVDDAEQEDGEYYHGESVAPLKTRGSKQERGRSRSPPAASSSSNSKPNHSPALVEVYSPTLPLSPGGLERHDMMTVEARGASGGKECFRSFMGWR